MDRKTFFNEMAPSWDERFYTHELKGRLAGLISLFDIKCGEKILDVGSGTGGIIPYLLEASAPNGLVYAIDYAEEMVKIAKEKFFQESRVRFHVCSVETLPFEDSFFDRVICFGVFPHIEDREGALKEIYRVLKTQGGIIIAHALSSEEIKNHHRKADPVKYDCLPDEVVMRRLMRNAGFSILEIIDKPGCYVCKGIKQK